MFDLGIIATSVTRANSYHANLSLPRRIPVHSSVARKVTIFYKSVKKSARFVDLSRFVIEGFSLPSFSKDLKVPKSAHVSLIVNLRRFSMKKTTRWSLQFLECCTLLSVLHIFLLVFLLCSARKHPRDCNYV